MTETEKINFTYAIQKINEEINEKAIRYKEKLSLTKERFNVFDCVPWNYFESLHSRFLAYLLDPKESHDCGDLFLRLFIETVKESKGVKEKFENIEFNFKSAEVAGEKDIGDGRIDVYIKIKDYIIAIENKISADDQPRQIKRYFDSLKSQCGEKFILFYLTRWGHDASQESKNDLTEGKDYFCLSYQKDILAWLKKCIEKIWKYPFVHVGLFYYQKLLERKILEIEEELMEEVKGVLLDNPEVLKHLRQEHIIETEKKLIKEFMKKLGDEFGEGVFDYENSKNDYGEVSVYHNCAESTGRYFEGVELKFTLQLVGMRYIRAGISNWEQEIKENLIKEFSEKRGVQVKRDDINPDEWICNSEQPKSFPKDETNLIYTLAKARKKDGMKELINDVFEFVKPYYEAWKELAKT